MLANLVKLTVLQWLIIPLSAVFFDFDLVTAAFGRQIGIFGPPFPFFNSRFSSFSRLRFVNFQRTGIYGHTIDFSRSFNRNLLFLYVMEQDIWTQS